MKRLTPQTGLIACTFAAAAVTIAIVSYNFGETAGREEGIETGKKLALIEYFAKIDKADRGEGSEEFLFPPIK